MFDAIDRLKKIEFEFGRELEKLEIDPDEAKKYINEVLQQEGFCK